MKNLLARFIRKPSPVASTPALSTATPKAQAAPIEPVRLPVAVARAVRPAWHTPGAAFPQKGRAPALADRLMATEMCTLRLGDFLDRIPPELLDAGTPDRALPMPFDLAVLSERIGRGDTTIRLAEVYRRMPDVFRTNAVIGQDRTIPFPWKKVLAMMQEAQAGAAEEGISRAGVEALALKFKARKLRVPGKVAPVPAVAGDCAKADAVGRAETPAFAPLSLVKTDAPGGPAALVAMTAKHAEELARLTAERDAAVARVAEFDAEYESMIGRTGELTAERDAAVARVAELGVERDAARALAQPPAAEDARVAELLAERDAALARGEKLAADSAAAMALAAELTAEREAAKAAAAGLATERDAATVRVAALATERNAVVAQIAALTAEREAAQARTAESTDESKAAAARLAEVIAERDAAVARAAKFFADSEASVALATELTEERDAVQARLATLNGQLDAAAARAHELTAERDAASARAAELLQKSAACGPAPEPPVTADESAAIVGFRNTIAALIHERDELRAETRQRAGQPTKRPSVLRFFAGKKAPVPSAPVELAPDVYSALFPQSLWMPRAVAIVVLSLLSLGIASQTTRDAAPALTAAPAAPALAQTDAAEPALAPEPAASEDAAPALSPEAPADETTDAASAPPAARKTVTSRRAR